MGCFARLIMWSENTPYSHVYVRWTWTSVDRDIIYQASKFSVNFESNKTFNNHAIPVEEYEIEISEKAHREVMQFCMDNSNKPYGVKEIFGMAWVKICSLFGRKISNPFPGGGETWICSKIGAAVLEIAKGIDIQESLDDIGPKDLNCIIKNLNLKQVK